MSHQIGPEVHESYQDKVERLTSAAEAGDGCYVHMELDGVDGLKERIQILNDMDRENAARRQYDPNLPDLHINRGLSQQGFTYFQTMELLDSRYLQMDPRRQQQYGRDSYRQNIYIESINLQTGTEDAQCAQLRRPHYRR
jgi:hypothetical protein